MSSNHPLPGLIQGQQQVSSRFHACGHARSMEAIVVKTDTEYQEGVNLPHWPQIELEPVIDGTDCDKKDDKGAVVAVREYQGYAKTRELLFSMFPQVSK